MLSRAKSVAVQLKTSVELYDWHSEVRTHADLDFDLLTSNKVGDQDLSCTIHLPSLTMIYLVDQWFLPRDARSASAVLLS